jgi:hypothetical protein
MSTVCVLCCRRLPQKLGVIFTISLLVFSFNKGAKKLSTKIENLKILILIILTRNANGQVTVEHLGYIF